MKGRENGKAWKWEGMKMKVYAWLIGGLAALDLAIKSEIEREGEDEFPRDLPGAKGKIRLHRSHNDGFPFGFLKQRPELVRAVPLAVASAAAGALAALSGRREARLQRLGLAVVLGGGISNLYDRFVRGYVVDYFSFGFGGRLKNVIFNLGDLFVFAGTLIVAAGELAGELRRKAD